MKANKAKTSWLASESTASNLTNGRELRQYGYFMAGIFSMIAAGNSAEQSASVLQAVSFAMLGIGLMGKSVITLNNHAKPQR